MILCVISDKIDLSIFNKSISLSNETKLLDIPNTILKSVDFITNNNYSFIYNGYHNKLFLNFFGKIEGYYLNHDSNLILHIVKNGEIVHSEICFIVAGEKLTDYNFNIKTIFDIANNDIIEIKISNFKHNQYYFFIESYLRINNI